MGRRCRSLPRRPRRTRRSRPPTAQRLPRRDETFRETDRDPRSHVDVASPPTTPASSASSVRPFPARSAALRANTKEVAVELGLPVIENPPDIATHPELPACCTHQTVSTTPPDAIRKLQQPHYWGGDTWSHNYGRRGCVEGSYGNRKNPSTENVDRGQNQIFGLAWLHITHAFIAASHNTRRLTTWAQSHPEHPTPNTTHPTQPTTHRHARPRHVTLRNTSNATTRRA